MQISVGRIVLYRLAPKDLEAIKASKKKIGGEHIIGQELPLIITRAILDQYGKGVHGANGHVILDGDGSLWVEGIQERNEPGFWHWPERQT